MHYGVPSFLKINCLDHFRVQITGEHAWEHKKGNGDIAGSCMS